MDFCGIYKITNKNNGKCYIGQSVDIPARWRQHISESQNTESVAFNCHFYRAIRKYGVDNFTFEIVEFCNPNELNDREIYYIGKFNSYEYGYNMTIGGQDFSCTTQKAVDQYDVEGNLICTYKSIAEARRKTGVRHIDRVLRGISRTAGGFYWNYHGAGFQMRDVGTHARRIQQYDLDGNFIKEFDSIKDAIDETGVTSIVYACTNHTRAGNWLWIYAGDDVVPYSYPKQRPCSIRPVDCFSKEGKFIASYFSMGDAERNTTASQANISACCQGKIKSAGGYVWRYADK